MLEALETLITNLSSYMSELSTIWGYVQTIYESFSELIGSDESSSIISTVVEYLIGLIS